MEERLAYRLLALDLDGTIVDRLLEISPRVRRALRAAMDNGVHVTLASGRPFEATRFFANQLGIQEPLICQQGAMVRDPRSGKTYVRRILPRSLAHEVVDIGREHDWVLCLTLDDEQYVERPSPALRILLELSPTLNEAHVVDDLKALADDSLRLLVVAATPAEADTVDKLLHAHFAGRLAIVRSYTHFVEATALGASKGQALAFLAQKLGVSQEETMAIGDQDNDADMVAWAGLGVAMGNASAAVKAAARHVTAAVEEDGAALAIEQFILGRGDG